MKRLCKIPFKALSRLGIHRRTLKLCSSPSDLRSFFNDMLKFRSLSRKTRGRNFTLTLQDLQPCMRDKTTVTPFDDHYIFHPAWAARVLAKTRPNLHIDISSTLAFCTMVSAFIPMKFYDYRPISAQLSGFSSEFADLSALPFEDNSVASLSCMHVIEHIGLGRYGDKIDPAGDIKAMKELKRVLKRGGDLLFVVPVGKPKLMFNAHRIYSYEEIMEHFSDLELKEFALLPESRNRETLASTSDSSLVAKQSYACGCFWFQKKEKE